MQSDRPVGHGKRIVEKRALPKVCSVAHPSLDIIIPGIPASTEHIRNLLPDDLLGGGALARHRISKIVRLDAVISGEEPANSRRQGLPREIAQTDRCI